MKISEGKLAKVVTSMDNTLGTCLGYIGITIGNALDTM